jgi:hypothetical protein
VRAEIQTRVAGRVESAAGGCRCGSGTVAGSNTAAGRRRTSLSTKCVSALAGRRARGSRE